MVEENMYEKYDNKVEDIIQAQNGNQDAMEKLIKDNQGLIWSIVKRFTGRGFEIEDLYQLATLGFIKCIKKFDSSFEVRLSTYAVPYILGEVKRYVQEDEPIKVSRAIKEMSYKIELLQREHLKKTGKDIKIEEVAKELGVGKEDIILALDSKKTVSSIYDCTSNDEEDGINILDRIASEIDEQSEITDKIAVIQLIEGLYEKEKEVILLRYYKGKTQTEVAKILGTTQVQVSRIEKRALETMKKKLTQDVVLT